MTPGYLLASLSWAVAGLIVGYWLGSLNGERPMTTPPASTAASRLRRARFDHLLGLALIVLAVVSVAVSAVAISNQREAIDRQTAYAECQGAYNAAFRNADAARRQAAADERQAQRDLLAASFDPAASDASLADAYAAYLAVLAAADERRNDNPLPVAAC